MSSNIAFKPVVTESVSAQIAEKIRESILDGRLKVDDRLPTEEELAVQFDVSRPTIREALKRLAAQHLVRSRRGPTGGTFVSRPTLEDLSWNLTTASTLMVTLSEFSIADILEARQELEVLCARLAAKRRTPQHLRGMEKEIEFQKQARVSDIEFCASDVRFHRLLTDASQNPMLRFLMYAVVEALQPVENMIIFRFRERKMIVQQHERILAAIRSKNASRAGNSIKAQIEYIRAQFSAAQQWRKKRERGVGTQSGARRGRVSAR